jgi:hypothetical protein
VYLSIKISIQEFEGGRPSIKQIIYYENNPVELLKSMPTTRFIRTVCERKNSLELA